MAKITWNKQKRNYITSESTSTGLDYLISQYGKKFKIAAYRESGAESRMRKPWASSFDEAKKLCEENEKRHINLRPNPEDAIRL